MKPNHDLGKILILGIGNYLMGDEGVGVHFAKIFSKETWPEGVTVIDGGTGGFHLTDILESFSHVILIDATLDGRPPGTIRVIEPRFSSDYPKAMSTHDIGMKDLIDAMTLMGTVPKIHLITVSIESLQQQAINLSPEIEAVLPKLESIAREIINSIRDQEL